jgi:hypothetical protein
MKTRSSKSAHKELANRHEGDSLSGRFDERRCAEGHALPLAVERVVPAPEFAAGWHHQQEQAIAVGQL